MLESDEGFVALKESSALKRNKTNVNSNKDDNFHGKYLPCFYLWLLSIKNPRAKEGKSFRLSFFISLALPPSRGNEARTFLSFILFFVGACEEIIWWFFRSRSPAKLRRETFLLARSFFISLRWNFYFLTRKFFAFPLHHETLWASMRRAPGASWREGVCIPTRPSCSSEGKSFQLYFGA